MPEVNVLLPSKITQLSNTAFAAISLTKVLLPSKITQLSNYVIAYKGVPQVLLPSKITQLSNVGISKHRRLRFYYPLKLHNSQTASIN